MNDTQYNDTTDDALSALMTDDADPILESDTDEDEQLDVADADADGADTDDLELQDDDGMLEIDDADFDTRYKYGDEQFTLAELIDARKNAPAMSVLEQERQELEQLKQEVEDSRERYKYTELEDIPHQFLTQSLRPMLSKGTLPLEIYQGIKKLFDNAISNGLYNPEQVEAQAEANRQKLSLENERKAIEQERNQARVQREIADVEQKHGKVTPEIANKLLSHIQDTYKRTGTLPTLIQAADALKTKGVFAQPVATKRKLADRHRQKQPAKPNKTEITSRDALRAFYN